jgi:Chaperone of endosialidase
MKTPFPIFFIIFSLAGFAFLPNSRAVNPPPDGAYPGGTAEGHLALASLNTSAGLYNTAVGVYSLLSITDGDFCTGVGAGTLFANTANENTATGAGALFSNTTGSDNAATGAFALFLNTTGTFNTAVGDSALFNNATGTENTAVGISALLSNTNGNANTAVGIDALLNNTAGNGNIAIGSGAGGSISTANNVICIGSAVGDNVSNTTWIGNVFGTTTVSGTTQPVIVSNTGQLGTVSSSRRFKKQIKPMDQVSESILALKPVTFRYKADETNTPQFGLVAEDVAAVNADLVAHDENAEIYSVRYEAVNAMLLNEFLKEHRKVLQLEATVTQQQKSFQSRVAEQEKQIEALRSGLQKVTAQIEMSKAASKVVARIQ